MPLDTDQLIFKIFDFLDKQFFSGGYEATANNHIEQLISALMTLVGSFLLCWIMYRGYKILWGKSNDNIKDFLWDAFLKTIFIIICLFPSEWLFLVREAFKGFRELTGLSGSVYNQGDTKSLIFNIQLYWQQTATIVREMNVKPFFDDITGAFIAPIISIVVFMGFFIGAFSFIMALVANMLSFFILLAIMPIAFYFLIYGNFTKQIFVQWFNMILSNTITLVFLYLFGSIIFAVSNHIYSDLINGISNNLAYWKVGAIWFCVGVFLNSYSSLVSSLAEKLTQVSLESSASVMGGKMAQITGGMAGLGMLGGTKAIKGLWSMNKKARLDRAEGKNLFNFMKSNKGNSNAGK